MNARDTMRLPRISARSWTILQSIGVNIEDSADVFEIAKLVKNLFRHSGFELLRLPTAIPRPANGDYSNLGEQLVIRDHLDKMPVEHRFCVDIAASGGVRMSNTFALFKGGWSGLAVEGNPSMFAELARAYSLFSTVNLAKCMVTPQNVIALLEANGTPVEFGFLNLDIDSYDYFVLERVLERYRPALICAEVNEKIPPPVKFTVQWDPKFVWAGDHFYGQSIAKLHELCIRFNYSLTQLHYNNAFLVPAEICQMPALTPEQAYRLGYADKPDRTTLFSWNADMDSVLNLGPEDALIYIRKYFSKYQGKYQLYL